jgi:GTP-binding protein
MTMMTMTMIPQTIGSSLTRRFLTISPPVVVVGGSGACSGSRQLSRFVVPFMVSQNTNIRNSTKHSTIGSSYNPGVQTTGRRHLNIDSNYRGSGSRGSSKNDTNNSSNNSKKNNNNSSNNKRSRGRQSYRFIDRTRVQVSGGVGWKGSLSMYHIGRKQKRRPDGGHGGNGGSVIIVADPNEQSLRWTKPHVVAESGTHGTSQEMHGRNGKNIVVRVPCGVVVRRVLEYDEYYDTQTKTVQKMYQPPPQLDDNDDVYEEEEDDYRGRSAKRFLLDKNDDRNFNSQYEQFKRQGAYLASNDYDSDDEDNDNDDDSYDNEYNDNINHNKNNNFNMFEDSPGSPGTTGFIPWGERERVQIADLNEPGSFVVVARGGRGGVGSCIFASKHGPTPNPTILSKYATPQPGENAILELELKLIADIGLVGFPNAGKSSLLAATSRATPYIAPYPFTTLNPLVGYIEYKDGFRICAAEVPGLIAGASEGRGRGHDFLRHLERTKALLYIVDAAGVDGRDPIQDFQTLLSELKAYGNGDMLNRRCLVVANKLDLLLKDEQELIMDGLQEKANEAGIRMETNVIGISAGVTGKGLSALTKAIRQTVLSSEEDKRRELNYSAGAVIGIAAS